MSYNNNGEDCVYINHYTQKIEDDTTNPSDYTNTKNKIYNLDYIYHHNNFLNISSEDYYAYFKLDTVLKPKPAKKSFENFIDLYNQILNSNNTTWVYSNYIYEKFNYIYVFDHNKICDIYSIYHKFLKTRLHNFILTPIYGVDKNYTDRTYIKYYIVDHTIDTSTIENKIIYRTYAPRFGSKRYTFKNIDNNYY